MSLKLLWFVSGSKHEINMYVAMQVVVHDNKIREKPVSQQQVECPF